MSGFLGILGLENDLVVMTDSHCGGKAMYMLMMTLWTSWTHYLLTDVTTLIVLLISILLTVCHLIPVTWNN